MIDKLKKIKHILENNPNEYSEELTNFCQGNINLQTLRDCIINDDYKKMLENTLEKNEITDLDLLDRIYFFKDFPEWFFVFCEKNNLHIANVLYDYYQEFDLSAEIIEFVEDNASYYLEEVLRNLIFPERIHFELIHENNNYSVREYFTQIDESLSNLENLNITNLNIEKMKFFKLQEYIDSKPIIFARYVEELTALHEDYEFVKKLYETSNERTTPEDFYKLFLAQKMKLEGMFTIQRDYIRYSLYDNPIHHIVDIIRHSYEQHVEMNARKKSVGKNILFTTGKLGLSIAYPPSWVNLPKDSIELIDNIKDLKEASEDIISLQAKSLDLLGLYNEFKASDFLYIKDFFINKAKNSVYKTIQGEFKLPITLSDKVFENLYNDFFASHVTPLIEMNETIKEQLEHVEDEHTFLFEVLFG